ncbi:glycosyltransferase family 4 protein [Ktedonosporobacter rubrisoli]|uniref:Glycosyltransferase family 4 protein n=1 Tax=Ktedonosporobacter rubrisoli TaxID=2509675 RepID=A0A4P6JZ51_KTERU|nr:glycosyltransferase [Ktedonosporobacter rubrisoli]QBD81057.1 glycosyltransferase family 4 protein [Ktedonosporobacter rubrisoli]
MRIMIVTDQYPPMVGGVPTVTRGLAIDFARRGHQVWVVAPSYGPRDVRRLEHKVRVYRFSSFEWPAYEGLRIPFLPFGPVRNLIKRADPDIIHIHSPVVLGNIAQILAGGLRKPVIVTNHYLPINISRSLMSDPIIGKYFSLVSYSYLVYFCNRCEYVTTPTTTALDLLYEHGLRAPAKAISNGIDLKRFSPGPANPAIRQRFNLPQNEPLILHVNRLSEEKRIDVLLDALARTQSKGHVALVGTGPMEADLRAQVERLGLNERVSFLGFVRDSELLKLRRSANLFVIPSEADLQSLATMEAMACGLPVIAANSYALPELVHHGENGFLFQPGNHEELARQIDLMLDDEDLRARMGAESLRLIAQHDRNLILDQWEELYRRLSIEFREAKERKQRMRMLRKAQSRLLHSPRQVMAMSHTGELGFDQAGANTSWSERRNIFVEEQ